MIFMRKSIFLFVTSLIFGTFSFQVPISQAETILSGMTIVSDTIWNEDGSPYIINNSSSIRVAPGVKLSIEPGVVVKFGNRSGLNVQGVLNAIGSENKPIIFTSIYDDTVAGDSNGDGNLTQPSEFDNWYINLSGSSVENVLSYIEVCYTDNGFFLFETAATFTNSRFISTSGILGAARSRIVLDKIYASDLWDDALWVSGGSLVIKDSKIRDVFNGDAMGFYNGAKVNIFNSSVENIGFGSSLGLYSSHATVTDSVFSGGDDDGVEIYSGSTLSITGSIIENFSGVGFSAYSSNVLISETAIRDNGEGINIYNSNSIKPPIPIKGNSISGNLGYGIYVSLSTSNPSITLDASGNFWGDPSGPYHVLLNPEGLGDSVSNRVQFEPWLLTDPLVDSCCSSVLFIPGLEASRLYQPGLLFENQLWEPNRNDDVRKLALSPETGESLNQDIYTRDVIDEVSGTVNIYKGFLEYMNGLVETGDIPHFETLPYDWRMSVKDVATLPVQLEGGGSYSMISRIEELAAASPTGKVTIITHSNGGLVAKELVEELKRRGEESLVERIIMVAAPQLGTPKAIFEMLHGTDFFLNFPSREVTRELAENMKSAYALLPSREYFNRLGAPPIRPLVEFSTTTSVTQYLRNIYGNSISDYDNLRGFLRGENGLRSEPLASDVNTPNVLKEHFLQNAEAAHQLLDEWTPPEGINVIEIIGWGLDTLRGVKYRAVKKKVCNADLSVCGKVDVIDPQPLTTSEGDGTVVYPSAGALGGERYWVEISEYNKSGFLSSTLNRDHKNILEISSLQNLISTLLKNEATSTLPDFISSSEPITSDTDKRLRIGVHSPVTLHLYDSLGRHTGPIPNPDTSSDLELYEERIPNTYYWQIGEGQYSGVDGATTTTLVLNGKELGTFTLEVEEAIGGNTVTSVYENIPVTASTTATIDVGSALGPLILDIDGDGVTDVVLENGEEGITAEELIAILKGIIKTFNLPDNKEKNLLKKLEKLEKELAKEHNSDKKEKRKTNKAFDELIKKIRQFEKKKLLITEEDGELINIIEQIRGGVVE